MSKIAMPPDPDPDLMAALRAEGVLDIKVTPRYWPPLTIDGMNKLLTGVISTIDGHDIEITHQCGTKQTATVGRGWEKAFSIKDYAITLARQCPNTKCQWDRSARTIQVKCRYCGYIQKRQVPPAEYRDIYMEMSNSLSPVWFMSQASDYKDVARIVTADLGPASTRLLEEVQKECQYITTKYHEGSPYGTDRRAPEGNLNPSARLDSLDRTLRSIMGTSPFSVGGSSQPREGARPRLELPKEVSDEPIRALRSCHIEFDTAENGGTGSGEPRLHSVAKQHWLALEQMAVCMPAFGGANRHEAPDANCRCGFYAKREGYTGPDTYDISASAYVGLQVEFRGKVIEHEDGWRAQHQTILQVDINHKCRRLDCSEQAVAVSPLEAGQPNLYPYCLDHLYLPMAYSLRDLRNLWQVDVEWYDAAS